MYIHLWYVWYEDHMENAKETPVSWGRPVDVSATDWVLALDISTMEVCWVPKMFHRPAWRMASTWTIPWLTSLCRCLFLIRTFWELGWSLGPWESDGSLAATVHAAWERMTLNFSLKFLGFFGVALAMFFFKHLKDMWIHVTCLHSFGSTGKMKRWWRW